MICACISHSPDSCLILRSSLWKLHIIACQVKKISEEVFLPALTLLLAVCPSWTRVHLKSKWRCYWITHNAVHVFSFSFKCTSHSLRLIFSFSLKHLHLFRVWHEEILGTLNYQGHNPSSWSLITYNCLPKSRGIKKRKKITPEQNTKRISMGCNWSWNMQQL